MYRTNIKNKKAVFLRFHGCFYAIFDKSDIETIKNISKKIFLCHGTPIHMVIEGNWYFKFR